MGRGYQNWSYGNPGSLDLFPSHIHLRFWDILKHIPNIPPRLGRHRVYPPFQEASCSKFVVTQFCFHFCEDVLAKVNVGPDGPGEWKLMNKGPTPFGPIPCNPLCLHNPVTPPGLVRRVL